MTSGVNCRSEGRDNRDGTQEYRRGRRYRLGRKGSLIQEVAMMGQLTDKMGPGWSRAS